MAVPRLPMRFTLVIILSLSFLFGIGAVSAQSGELFPHPDSLFKRTDFLIQKKGDWDAAAQLLSKHLPIYEGAEHAYTRVRCLTLLGFMRRARGLYDEAMPYYDEAMRICNDSISSPEFMNMLGKCKTHLMDMRARQGDMAAAKRYGDEALQLYAKTGNDLERSKVLVQLGYMEYRRERPREALFYYNESLVIRVREWMGSVLFFAPKNEQESGLKSIAYVLGIIGSVQMYMEDVEAALRMYEQAYDIRKEILDPKQYEMMMNRQSLAYAYHRRGYHRKAELMAEEILEEFTEFSAKDAIVIAQVYRLVGDVRFNRKDYATARDYYERSATLLRENGYDKHQDMELCYESLAEVAKELGEDAVAEMNYRKALDLQSDGGDSHVRTRMRYLLGLADVKAGYNPASAQLIYEEGMRIARDNEDLNKPRFLGEVYHKYGRFLLENADSTQGAAYLLRADSLLALPELFPEKLSGRNAATIAGLHRSDPARYLEWMDKAIQRTQDTDNSPSPSGLPERDDIVYPLQLLDFYMEKGDFFQGIKEPKEALLQYELAADLVDIIKPIYKYEGSKDILYNQSLILYGKILPIATSLFQKDGDQRYYELAFACAEKSKSMHLSDVLRGYKASDLAGLPDSLLEKETAFKTDIAYYKQKLHATPGYEEIARRRVKERLMTLEHDYQRHLHRMEQEYPSYYDMKYTPAALDVEGLRRSLPPDELVLEYYLRDSSLTIFALTGNERRIWVEDIGRDSLSAKIQTLNRHLADQSLPGYAPLAKELYDLLLGKALSQFPETGKLTIVPDGILNYLSFDSLIERLPDGRDDFTSLPYLIHDYAIGYNYAISNRNALPAKERRPRKAFLGIAPRYEGDTLLQPLPYAREEVGTIAGIMGGDAPILDNAATVTRFKELSGDYAVIHIAGHTIVDDSLPLRSNLVFSPHGEGRHLYAYELYNMSVNADMVTLSACNSGNGRFKVGEGAMSLSRGFRYAGCPATVTTLWSVSDKPTMEVMEAYYQQLQTGASKSAALRAAKLAYLKNATPAEAPPFYWSGIVVVGDDSPLVPQGTGRGWLFWGILSAGLVILVFLWWKNKK